MRKERRLSQCLYRNLKVNTILNKLIAKLKEIVELNKQKLVEKNGIQIYFKFD